MRLWHIELLPVLPRQQLLGQNRECACMEAEILEKGEVHHILVNFVNYDHIALCIYHGMVMKEMVKRGYKLSDCTLLHMQALWEKQQGVASDTIFSNKFTNRYLRQCLYNLQEKYDCGGITQDEWKLIYAKFEELLK